MSRLLSVVLCGAAVVFNSASSQGSNFGLPSSSSQEERKGYCEGFSDAMKMIQDNRAQYRRLLGQPQMSQEEVLRWIYERPWIDDANHRTAPRRLDQPPGTPSIGPPAIESIDLYLIPGITGCSVNDGGEMEFKRLDWPG